jgi:hypothetical protein
VARKHIVQANLYFDFAAVDDDVSIEGGTRREDISDDYSHYKRHKDDDDQSEGCANNNEGEIVVISESCFECY